MNAASQFFWGFAGSVASEIVDLARTLQSTPNRLPACYRSPLFYIARLLLATVGGALAVAYQVDTPLLAFHVGIATPLIVRAFSKAQLLQPGG